MSTDSVGRSVGLVCSLRGGLSVIDRWSVDPRCSFFRIFEYSYYTLKTVASLKPIDGTLASGGDDDIDRWRPASQSVGKSVSQSAPGHSFIFSLPLSLPHRYSVDITNRST
eukprot:GHVU01133097.1.p1 GENE.GHVU01133097.1~~GHVU01133097.1.p1  ORF type:complete len:111 (+),score=0.76 GHVU01133097.1:132-464(+)